MDYAKALTFITEDPRWKEKIAIGGGVVLVSMLLSFILIGVIGFLILSGYGVRLLQNVRDGKTHPLPEWDAWGDDLIRGFKFLVVSLVWSLPAIIFTIPSTIGGMLTESGGSAEAVGGIIVFCATCLVSLYSLFVALVSPGFTIGFATDERIGSGLQFTKIWNWTQQNIGQVVIAVIVVVVATIAISLVGSIAGALLCLVGLVVTLPLAILITALYQYHIYGQLAYAFPYNGGDRVPVVPPTDWTPDATDLAVTPAEPEMPFQPETPAAPESQEPSSDATAESAPESDETEQPPAAQA
jgi:hypothetical protein